MDQVPPVEDQQRLCVALDVGPLYGHRTGVGVAAAGILTALQRRADVRVEPYLVSFRSTPQPGHRRLPLPGIVASRLWAVSDRPSGDRWLQPADVVHGTNYVVPPSSRPAVVSVYDCWFLRHPERATPIVRRAGVRLRRAVDSGAWIHVPSTDTVDHVREVFGMDRIAVIPLGPPPPLADVGLADPGSIEPWLAGDSFVFAIGTEERRKDLPLLIEAFAIVADSHPRLRLVLAGAAGDDTAAVDQAIAQLDPAVVSRVRRLGTIDDALKHWLMRRAAVVAYPSLDEGFGFPLLEAQAAGTPVVASDVGAVGEVAGSGVVLVAGRDPGLFAAELDRAITDGVHRLNLITAGHHNLGRYSWDRTAALLVDLYRTAMRAGR